MRKRRRFVATRVGSALSAAAAVAAMGTMLLAAPLSARADTPADTLSGEGGDALTPAMIKLLQGDATGLSPDFGSYTNVGIEQAVTDFIGDGSGAASVNNDFLVSERPLSSAEAATAATDGRTFAYVPFAAVPVALVTLVPNNTYQSSSNILPSQFCQHMPLTVSAIADVFGYNATTPLVNWSDARTPCTTGGDLPSSSIISRWANEDQTMENHAMMSLLDSTSATQATFEGGLLNAQKNGSALTTDTTPSEYWPYSQPTIPGGDSALLGKILQLNPRTLQPSEQVALLAMGSITPVSNVWTGDPEGVHWNLPTAAVQNAQGAFVAPSSQAALAAENDATMATTSDPTTNNLVTFQGSTSDAAAYNSYLMLEEYLVVPTSGLAADKASALAQFIRFVLGGTGQADLASLGAAGATSAMVTAGLKIAQQLDTEAQAHSLSGSSTTTTTTAGGSGATTTTAAPGSTGTSGTSGTSGTGGTNATGGSGVLAVTGADLVPLLIAGSLLALMGEVSRRLVARRKAPRSAPANGSAAGHLVMPMADGGRRARRKAERTARMRVTP